MLLIAQMTGQLRMQAGLQHPLHQLRQKPALPGQLHPAFINPVHQLIQEPLVEELINRLLRRPLRTVSPRHNVHPVPRFLRSVYTDNLIRPRPITFGCTSAAICCATWDWANRTDSAACNAAAAAFSCSNRVNRSIRSRSVTPRTSRSSTQPATASANSTSIPSSRSHSESTGNAISGTDATPTDIPQTLPKTTDTIRSQVRYEQGQPAGRSDPFLVNAGKSLRALSSLTAIRRRRGNDSRTGLARQIQRLRLLIKISRSHTEADLAGSQHRAALIITHDHREPHPELPRRRSPGGGW